MRRFLRVLSHILMGSLVATRTGAAPIVDYDMEAKVRDDWRKVRHASLREVHLANLPDEVRQYLPGEGEWELDLPTSIRLSYAAARPSDFKALDEYWSAHPEVLSDGKARDAFDETRNWLAGQDGQIERAEPRQPTQLAMSGAVGTTVDFISPFDFVWNVQDQSDGDDDDDDDDDDYSGD